MERRARREWSHGWTRGGEFLEASGNEFSLFFFGFVIYIWSLSFYMFLLWSM